MTKADVSQLEKRKHTGWPQCNNARNKWPSFYASQQILKHLQINQYASFTLSTFFFKECTLFSCKQKPLQLHTPFIYKSLKLITEVTHTHLLTSKLLLWSAMPLSFCDHLNSPLLHIVSLCTLSADRVLFRHALCAFLRGSVSPSCRLLQHPPLLSGQIPGRSLCLWNPGGVVFLDRIPYCSHKWGYSEFLQRYELQETRPNLKLKWKKKSLIFTTVIDTCICINHSEKMKKQKINADQSPSQKTEIFKPVYNCH